MYFPSATRVQIFPEHFNGAFSPHLASGTWPRTVGQHLEIALPPAPDSAAHARQAAQALLAGHVRAAELHETLILLSEVVMNAVCHPVPRAGAQVAVHVGVARERIRAEVYDSGAGFDASALSGEPGVDGGWGLVIVDRAASRWGASTGERHCVWFELDRDVPMPRAA